MSKQFSDSDLEAYLDEALPEAAPLSPISAG